MMIKSLAVFKKLLTEKDILVDFVENTLIAREKLFNIIFDLLILDVMLQKKAVYLLHLN